MPRFAKSFLVFGLFVMVGGGVAYWVMSQRPAVSPMHPTETPAEQKPGAGSLVSAEPILPAHTTFQTVATANGFSFEWPQGWGVNQSKQQYTDIGSGSVQSEIKIKYADSISLSDSSGKVIAEIVCPILKVEGDYGVSSLYSQNRTISKNGEKISIDYTEQEDDTLARMQKIVQSVDMEVYANLDRYQQPGTCELSASASPNRNSPIASEHLAALRHIYESWK